MQPMQPRETREREAAAIFQGGRPPSPSQSGRRDAPGRAPGLLAAGRSPGEEEAAGDALDEVARREREDMRPRLRDELGREPTEEELDEWLRRHTEGY